MICLQLVSSVSRTKRIAFKDLMIEGTHFQIKPELGLVLSEPVLKPSGNENQFQYNKYSIFM